MIPKKKGTSLILTALEDAGSVPSCCARGADPAVRARQRKISDVPFFALAVLLPILLCTGAPCTAQTAPAPETVKVITYNVQFLPGFAGRWNKRAEPDYRARRIAEEVGNFDIVGLQETFDERYRRRIIEGVRKNWGEGLNDVVSPMADNHITNGGCLILTRSPILKSDSTVFKHYSSATDYGLRADGFAAKGVIHARIALGGESKAKNPTQKEGDRSLVDVYVTHLEARDGAMRSLQYEELAAFIKKTSDPRLPLILMGDLNTRGMPNTDGDSPYGTLMRLLNEARPSGGVIDVWTTLKGDAHGGTTEQDSEQHSEERGKRIDYIILGNPKPPARRLKPVAIRVNPYPDPKVTALSDHSAVEAEFEWKRERH